MKPGMQREILVAYWLLFDEFAADDDGGKNGGTTDRDHRTAPAGKDVAPENARRNSRTTTPRRAS